MAKKTSLANPSRLAFLLLLRIRSPLLLSSSLRDLQGERTNAATIRQTLAPAVGATPIIAGRNAGGAATPQIDRRGAAVHREARCNPTVRSHAFMAGVTCAETRSDPNLWMRMRVAAVPPTALGWAIRPRSRDAGEDEGEEGEQRQAGAVRSSAADGTVGAGSVSSRGSPTWTVGSLQPTP